MFVYSSLHGFHTHNHIMAVPVQNDPNMILILTNDQVKIYYLVLLTHRIHIHKLFEYLFSYVPSKNTYLLGLLYHNHIYIIYSSNNLL